MQSCVSFNADLNLLIQAWSVLVKGSARADLLEEGLWDVATQPKHHDAAVVQQVGSVIPHHHTSQRYAWRPAHSAKFHKAVAHSTGFHCTRIYCTAYPMCHYTVKSAALSIITNASLRYTRRPTHCAEAHKTVTCSTGSHCTAFPAFHCSVSSVNSPTQHCSSSPH